MRPIRRNIPGTLWFITSRAFQSRFLLLPRKQANEIIGFYFAQALRLFPSIRAYCLVSMSNHVHAAIEDGAGQLSRFAEHFFGNVARELNLLRDRRGKLFHRRFSAEEILDDDALAGRIRYTLLNPTADRLVDEYQDWPGLIAGPLFNTKMTFRRFNRRAFDLALRSAEPGCEPNRDDFYETEVLDLSPLPAGLDAHEIEADVR